MNDYVRKLKEHNEQLRQKIEETKKRNEAHKQKFKETHKTRKVGFRKLKAKWTVESQQDFTSFHTNDALSIAILQEIKDEEDEAFKRLAGNIAAIGGGGKRKVKSRTRKSRK
jgi:hypothetical protein